MAEPSTTGLHAAWTFDPRPPRPDWGIALPAVKRLSTRGPIQPAPPPAEAVISLAHAQGIATPLVRPGDRVLTGQPLARDARTDEHDHGDVARTDRFHDLVHRVDASAGRVQLNDQRFGVLLLSHANAALDIFLHGGHDRSFRLEHNYRRTSALGVDSARENREQA